MSSRTAKNKDANAEILGVVILIGIFAITAGIISATVLATPEPAKVPAASIEITGEPEAIHIAHLGGDPLPPDTLVRGTRADGTTETLTLDAWLDGISGEPLSNGFSETVNDDWDALAVIWSGGSGASVIASWDPTGIYGPLGPSAISGDVPTVQTPPPTQPAVPTPTTAWNATVQNITADFSPNRTAAETGGVVHFLDLSTGNVTVDAWSWNFGDGSPLSPLQNPDHTYPANGVYTVTLTASNLSTGASGTKVIDGCIQVTDMLSPVDFDMTATQGGVALTVVCTDISASSPTLWLWTTVDSLNGTVTTVGPDFTPVAMNDTYNPKIQTFTFYNPSGTINNVCTIKLEIWSPYFQSPISVTKSVTVGPPLQAEFTSDLPDWIGIAGREGASIHFQDRSVGLPQAWRWDFGDGTTSTEQNPVHTFTVGPNEIRAFHVTLTVSGWGQERSVAHDVTIYPPVIANSTAQPIEGSAPLEVHFTDISTGFPTSWLWDFGDGSSSTERNPIHTYDVVGKYRVTLFAERANPHSVCPETREITIYVGEEVVADFTGDPRSGEAPLPVQFSDLSSTNANLWSWTFGDGGTALGEPFPLHEYTVPGNYTVTLIAESDFRMDTETKVDYISVIGEIAASFTASSRAVPVGTSVRFNDTSTGNPYTFAWSFGDGTTSTERNPVHAYSAPGTYTVALTATNPLYSNTWTETGCITVYDHVTAMFDADVKRGRAPLPVKFTDLSTGTGITSWSWNFGDGGTSTQKNPSYTFTQPGVYDVSLTVSNGYTSHTSTAVQFVITVIGDLTATFTANQTAGPDPLTVQFTNTSAGTPESWEWDFNSDGVIDSTAQNPVHTFTGPGIYNVKLTVRHDDSTTSEPMPVTVYAPITARFQVNQSGGISPLSVQFTDTSTGGADGRRWEFGDGLVSTGANPVHTYASPGNYTANLTVWNLLRPDLTTVTSRSIVAYGIPNAAFTASRMTGSAPLTVRFTDTSTGNPTVTGWNWNFGDGTTSTEQNPVHTFVNGGAYTVTLRVANPAGQDPTPAARTISVIGGDVPVASFTTNVTSGADPLPVRFVDTSTNSPTRWSWNFGDGTTSTEQNPVHTFANAGTYQVTLTVSNLVGEGVAPATRTIYVT